MEDSICKLPITQSISIKNYKELSKLNVWKELQLENGQKTLTDIHQWKYTDGNNYMKSSPASLVIREIQMQTTMRYHHTQTKIAGGKKW